jgi:hypothetical protein
MELTGEKRCARCEQVKPPDAFSKDSQGRLGRQSRCRECQSESRRQQRLDARMQRLEQAKVEKTCKTCGETKPPAEFYLNGTAANGGNICLDCKRARDARSRERQADSIREASAAFRERNRDRLNAENRAKARALREQVLDAYGTECACCHETRYEFLTLDHIGGGGRAHRLATNGRVYADLKRKGFPPGYRTLCWNCNASRGRYGYCPHERERQEVAA